MPKNIMIVDDEEDIRIYLTAVLEDSGFLTCTVDEGENIFAALERHQPDLVLLDIMMPRRSGISIYRDLRSAPGISDIPVALISGIEKATGMFHDEFRALQDGRAIRPPDGFIEKPIRIQQLVEVIENILATKGETVESSA